MTTADRMAVLDQGVVQQVGAPASLYDDPVNAFVATFVGTMNLLPARVRTRAAGAVTLDVEGIGELQWSPPGGPPVADRVLLSFRPHVMQVQAAAAERDARHLWMTGTVAAREFLGEFTRYHVRIGDHALAVDQAHRGGLPAHLVGAAVSLGIEPAQIRLLPA